MKIDVLPDPQAAAARAAEWMARRIRTAVTERGVCRIAVSGGSTPTAMFDAMATMDLPWASLQVFQVDERVAPDGDPDRNAVQLVQHLTSRVPIKRSNLHLMPVTATSLSRAAAVYARKLSDGPLDIVHLGIGDDGHTASWPPGDAVVEVADPVAVTGEFNGRVRMTLTPSAVNIARSRMVLIVGAGKAGPLSKWVDDRADLPVQRVRRTATTLIVDAAAASQLRAVHAAPARRR